MTVRGTMPNTSAIRGSGEYSPVETGSAGAPPSGTDAVQTLVPAGLPTGGGFFASFKGAVSAEIDFEDAAAAILTALELLATIGSGGLGVTAVKAQGTLTQATQPTDLDTVVVGGITYTFLDVFVDAVNNVFTGADAAAAQVNLVAAISASGGTPGTTHFTSQVTNPLVTVGAFAADDMIATARQVGAAGDAIATTETYTDGTDAWDAATLGTTTAGADIVVTFDGDAVKKRVQPLLEIGNAFTGGTAPAVTVTNTTPGVDLFGIGRLGAGAFARELGDGDLYENQGTETTPSWVRVDTLPV